MKIMNEGFYKLEKGIVLYAPNFVCAPNYELEKGHNDKYTYPVDGWFWFNSEDEALAYFGIVKNVSIEN